MRRVQSRAGFDLPVIGQGTWRMGETPSRRHDEIAALRLGLDLGLDLIDTAEMYADGAAEEIVARAIEGRRDEVFLVSKVLPHNASRQGTLRAAEQSLRRLATDRIDLYLLHWPGSHPLHETYLAFEQLLDEGKILSYGVSNFDLAEMQSSESIPGGEAVGANQVLYNLTRRSIEHRLIPWCVRNRVTVMAYSPLEQGRLPGDAALREVARRHGCAPYQAALAWTLGREGVIAIPKASTADHVRQNAAAATLALTEQDLAELDRAFPRPPHERLDCL